jgi:hypothetical protein
MFFKTWQGYEPFNGRSLDTSRFVQVYRNLNRGGYSIRQGGLIVAHADTLVLQLCSMKVNRAGRRRVIKYRVKTVHAYIEGLVAAGAPAKGRVRIRYNPYEVSTFVTDKREVVRKAAWVIFGVDGVEMVKH